MDTWCDVGQVIKIWITLKEQGFWAEYISIGGGGEGKCERESKEGHKERVSNLLSTIHEVPWIGIRRAKNQSSSS